MLSNNWTLKNNNPTPTRSRITQKGLIVCPEEFRSKKDPILKHLRQRCSVTSIAVNLHL